MRLGNRKLATTARDVLLSTRLADKLVWPNRVGGAEMSLPKTALAILALATGNAKHREAANSAASWLSAHQQLWVDATHRDPDMQGVRWSHMTFSLCVQACLAGDILPQDLRDSSRYLNELWDESGKSWRDSLDLTSHIGGVVPSSAVIQAYVACQAAFGTSDPTDLLFDTPHYKKWAQEFALTIFSGQSIAVSMSHQRPRSVELTQRQRLILDCLVSGTQAGNEAAESREDLAAAYGRPVETLSRAIHRLNKLVREATGLERLITVRANSFVLNTRNWGYADEPDQPILKREELLQPHMQRHDEKGLTYFTFADLSSHAGTVHGIFSREGGVSSGAFHSLNASTAVGDHPENVRENLRRAADVLGVDLEMVFKPRLVHGDSVHYLDVGPDTDRHPEADAVITDLPGVLLVMTPADCAVVMFYDPRHSAIGMAHAGWKGIVAEIARKTIDAMVANYESQPDELLVAIGPSVGPCHYRLVEPAQKSMPTWAPYLEELEDGRTAIDLPGMLIDQLLDAGIEGQHLEVDRRCTACNVDTFFSFWVDKPVTGRMAVAFGLSSEE
jgi:YfiH family protein